MRYRVDSQMPADIFALHEAYAAIEHDAHSLAAGLSSACAEWRAEPSSWSVAECIDHLATANRVYLAAMRPVAEAALASGRHRHRPAVPGVLGGLFVRSLEPPVKPRFKLKAPTKIRPRSAPSFPDAMAAFLKSQEEVRRFLRAYADFDLAGVQFPNPFIPGLRFSLATGLHVIAAHDRRHLWQAWRVRHAGERAVAA